MKIAVIGPVPPFRSGVAKHTGEVAKALCAHGDVRVISFSRQYPALLFPGQDDRDAASAALAPAGTQYRLDSIAPLSWRAVRRDLVAWQPDIAVIPAWTFFTAPALTGIARALRGAGTRVISIVHNAADHDSAPWKRALLARQIANSDGCVTHNRGLADAIAEISPTMATQITPHPLFDYPTPNETLPRRAGLEVLMFGLVRPYKGADLLVSAMDALVGRDVHLTIAGEIWGDDGPLRTQIAASPAASQISLEARYLSDQETANQFARADVIALPYRSVTGSGVVPLAMHYGKPVIASDLAGFREIVRPGETGWRIPVGDVPALSACIAARLTKADCRALDAGIARARAALSWETFASEIIAIGETSAEKHAAA